MDPFLASSSKLGGKWINSSFCSSKEPLKPEKKIVSKRSASSTKFSRNFNGNAKTSTNDSWVEKYAPKKKVDLAVHKKKVEQVEEWLVSSFSGLKNTGRNKAPILLLTGPSGSGKSATVRVLAEEMNFELQEWDNVTHLNYRQYVNRDNDLDANDWWEERQADTFRNFIIRSSKYCSVFNNSMKKVILIEDFPNVFIQDASVFHSILRKFSASGRVPAVFIISDNSRGDVSERHLFPKDLQEGLNVTQISFNSIANGSMGKVLNNILVAENKKYGASEKLNLDKFIESSNGDIRNAINLLQFSVLPDSKRNFEKAKKQRTENSTNSVKNTNLFLFHALGKVLYCKRSSEVTEPNLPLHLSKFQRKQLIESPENIFEKTAVSPDGFNLFLHHNYPDFMPDIVTMSEAAEFFSQADYIGSQWSEQNVSSDYSVSLAVRGLMFQLNSESKGQARKWRALHKPDWYAKHRKTQENMVSLSHSFPEWKLGFGEELQTVFLPYMAKMKPQVQTQRQKAVLSTLTTFTRVGSSFSQTARPSQSDTFLEEEEIESNFVCSVEPLEPIAIANDADDELIEEFDY